VAFPPFRALLAAALTITSLQAGQTEPTIRTTTSEVLLDLVVRDKHGRVVRNLKPEEVEILEDGAPQRILGFRFAAAPPVEVRQTPAAAAAPVAAPAPPPARSLRAVNPIFIVFHNLDPAVRTRAIEVVKEFLSAGMRPEDYVGLFLLDDRLKPVHAFTNDRAEVARALDKAFVGQALDFDRASEAVLTANPLEGAVVVTLDPSGHGASADLQVTGGEISPGVYAGAEVSNGDGANRMRGDRIRERGDFRDIQGRRAEDMLNKMIGQAGALPGRKTLLLITAGLLTSGDPDRFDAMLARAHRLGLTIYVLDVRGLDMTSTAQAGKLALGEVSRVSRTQSSINSSLGAMRAKSRQGDNMEDAVRTSDTQASLRALADGTGGFLIANTNEFRKPFERILEDVDAHYEAAYRPTSETYDGRLRKIEVRLARRDLTVESRKGYFAIPDLPGSGALQPFETGALEVLNARPRIHSFDFRAAALAFHDEAVLTFEAPGASFKAEPAAVAGSHKVHLSLLALVKDAGGQIVDKFSVDAPFEIPDANLAAARASAITYTHPVSLPPGRYTVESAVVDRLGRSGSTYVTQLEIPPPRPGLALSSIVLVQRVEPAGSGAGQPDPLVFQGKRVAPTLATTLPADSQPYVYFVVYPDRANPAPPDIEVEFLVGGKVLARQTAALPPADASGAVPMLVAAAARPGDCELRIRARQGAESASESLPYTIVARLQ
jgi:VWFA-related protein